MEYGYESGLWIQTVDSDDFQNLMGTSLSKVTFVVKFSQRSDRSVQRYEPTVENALSRNVEESFKKFLDPYPAADDFQNLICSSLSTDISVVKFSRRSVQ